MKPLLLLAVTLVAAVPALSFGQSLADVARAEAARRKSVTTPSKVYTNADLNADFTAPAPPPPPDAPATEPQEASADTQVGEKPAAEASSPAVSVSPMAAPQDEAAWRKRITTARAALERSQMFAESLQSRINALTTDFVNRDDPAQRAVIEQDRQRALAELDRVKKEQAQQAKAIADIEEEARKAGVPPGWLR